MIFMHEFFIKAALGFCFFSWAVSVTCAFKLGVENISVDVLQWLHHHPVGLVTNQTGKDQNGARTVDILVQNHHVPVKAIFVPEHGFSGNVAAAQEVTDGVDKKTSLPIVSLYGHGGGKGLSVEALSGIDGFIFDIQDCGMRHFTYISTLLSVLSAAAAHDKTMIVLDRPNPLGPSMEGPLVEDSLHSFQAIAPIPLRHGMTIGELAQYFNQHMLKKPAKLQVVPMQGYDRTMKVSEQLVANLSPNLQSRDACYGYSFLGILGEVRPFKLGVGTSAAFCSILLPQAITLSEKNWGEFGVLLKSLAIDSTPYEYMPANGKQLQKGVRLSIDDITAVASMKTLLGVLEFFKTKGVVLTFSPSFDRAVGTSKIREYLQGNSTKDVLSQYINTGLHTFYKQVEPLFLYTPHPKIIEL
jgi:uncharacterized protein YbbC (DUF1343 family)